MTLLTLEQKIEKILSKLLLFEQMHGLDGGITKLEAKQQILSLLTEEKQKSYIAGMKEEMRLCQERLNNQESNHSNTDIDDDLEWEQWIKEPFPDIDIQNETKLDNFLWSYMLTFRDFTQIGSRHGMYLASRNKVIAEAKIELLSLINEEKLTSNLDTLQSLKNILTGSDDFIIEPGVKLNLSIGQICTIRDVCDNVAKSYRLQALKQSITNGDK